MKAPLLSVVVATWNRPERLAEALKSLALQGDDVRFEVIVVNDGGVDVADVIAPWARMMTVQYVRLDENSGLAHARNEGIRRAGGDVLCFLDDDDVMLPGHLRGGVEQLNGVVDGVCTHVAVCDEFVAAGSIPQPEQIKARYAATFDDRLLMICNFLPVSAMFLRRRSGASIEFDESLEQLEDWDLWLRLRQQAGYQFKTVPRATAVYHRVPGFGSMTNRSHESADEALRFRETFRRIVARYPSKDEIIAVGRELHQHFYAAVAQARGSGAPVNPFAYERFVECMEAYTRGAFTAEAARERIDAVVTASDLPVSSQSRGLAPRRE